MNTESIFTYKSGEDIAEYIRDVIGIETNAESISLDRPITDLQSITIEEQIKNLEIGGFEVLENGDKFGMVFYMTYSDPSIGDEDRDPDTPLCVLSIKKCRILKSKRIVKKCA